jgi:hypothetical protein
MHAFKGCSSLTDINYGGTIEQWGKIILDDEWNKNVPTKKVSCSGVPVKISPNGLQMNPDHLPHGKDSTTNTLQYGQDTVFTIVRKIRDGNGREPHISPQLKTYSPLNT